MRIALANLAIPQSPAVAVRAAVAAVASAAAEGADLICFPECFVPGYRALGAPVPILDQPALDAALAEVAAAAGRHGVTVVLGTERWEAGRLRICSVVIGPDGVVAGRQDKVQLDPSEDELYEPASGPRRLFDVAGVKFGVVICHEGFRYPETVRELVLAGAQLVLLPHYSDPLPGHFPPDYYGDPRLSFHEASLLCRAAENTCWVAGVNCAVPEAPTSAVARPDGTLAAWQPHGEPGLLFADVELALATRRMALRWRG